jgi:hypothetical protein
MTNRALLLPILLMLGAAACEEYGPRVYTAQPYQVGDTCLQPSVPIGVVKAAELRANCEPVCLLLDGALYVSRVCPPLPERALETAADAGTDCANAVSLLRSQALCASPSPAFEAGFPDASALDGGAGDARATSP